MELLNSTGMLDGYTMGMKPDGRELLVVAIKATFTIPKSGEKPQLAEQQAPLIMADTFTGEPGYSAPFYEVDYSPIKHRCDVLLNGSAYAPQGRPARMVQVGMRVGTLVKTFNVVGDRCWNAGVVITPEPPAEFTVLPISYDKAFGGLDNFHDDKNKHSAYMLNPVGKGYHQRLASELVDGMPMPNTEEANRPVQTPNGDYKPMAFGPLGRGWSPRLQYAGTYDQDWIDNIFPFLPADFQEAYYQAAPEDQQIPYLKGGEEVVLINLSPEGRIAFTLPVIEMPVVFFRKKGERHETFAVIDTLVIEPDKGTFSLTWRASLPLKKNMFEIPQVLVGKMSPGWWRARELGKTYYPSLAHLAKANKAAAEEEE
ncbi:DUF2169 family type VI secretion system accessory protein [Crenothrix polyspora]|uniref:DUF2169 domain-containing protein n=1 Tax=Crenothrix polyspora TaxID=360316 RepID=A0A1R4HA17_9GAMM|nr:DUF2169 domain-containing protein [Crenothrix polyspora]SJM93104.1 conserved hypothetical protein [Crenothrix polyspora]